MTPSSIDAGRLDADLPAWSSRRPLRLALLGDFGGGARPRALTEPGALAARRPRRVDFDSFDEVVAQAGLAVDLPLPSGAIAALTIETLDDLHPDELLRQLPRGTATPESLRALLAHPDLRRIESAWRGVDLLVRELGPGASLEIHLFDITADELGAMLDGNEDLSRNALYAWLVQRPAEDADGGYGAIAVLHDGGATPAALSRLARLARIAAHAGAPLFTARDTDPLADRRRPPERAVRNAFAALQARPEAGFLCLAGPRFQLRHCYGRRTDPVSAFDFEEFDPRLGLRAMCWGHPALVTLLAWYRGGDLILRDRPLQVMLDADGDRIALPCTDRLIRADMSVTLRDYGVQALMAARNEPSLRILGLSAVDGTALSRLGPKPALKSVPEGAREDEKHASASGLGADDALESLLDRLHAESVATGAGDGTGDSASGHADEHANERADARGDAEGAASSEALAPDAAPVAPTEPSTTAQDPTPADDDAMDPELAALLKSLE